MNVVRKKIKMEIILAVTLAISLSISVIYLSQPRDGTRWYAMPLSFQSKTSWESGLSNVEKIVEEEIVGELRKDFFETVIEDIKNLTFHYGGRMPYLNMIYEDDLWSGWMKCKVPSENMTMFTFDVRRLIDEYGKVTYITVRVTEIEANQTQPPETHFSEVTIRAITYSKPVSNSDFLSYNRIDMDCSRNNFRRSTMLCIAWRSHAC